MLAEMSLPPLARDFEDDASLSPTLPGPYYYSATVFEAERSAVFFRSWQFVCHISKLREPGHYQVFEIDDQSIIVLRTKQGALKAFHNVCQHRAHRLLEGGGEIPGSIVCPYHGWNYDTDGRLTAARRTNRMADFDRSRICLGTVLVEILAGLVFVNLDAHARSLGETYPGLEREIRGFLDRPEDLQFAYTKDYPLAANWKNSVENYSECYHCPKCHPSLSTQALDMESYSITVNKNFHSHLSGDRGSQQGYAMRAGGAMSNHFGAWFIWPNVCVEFYPGGYMNVLYHRPTGPETTTQVVEWYCADKTPSKDEQDVIDFVAITREEDLPICESVQRGLHSRAYSQGRFVVDSQRSDHSEHAVHDFQRLVLKSLGGQHADKPVSRVI